MCLVVLPPARLPSWVCPVVVGDTLWIQKCHPVPECYSPSPHPMTTAFGSIVAESDEWARGLCPAGLVSAGGRLGMKVTEASTVKDSASLLLIPSIPSWSRGTPSSTGPCGPR